MTGCNDILLLIDRLFRVDIKKIHKIHITVDCFSEEK